MAQLKNTARIASLVQGERLTVGHNRTVERAGAHFVCRLHGHAVAVIAPRIDGAAEIELNPCGRPTRTTAAAMEDFTSAFGCSVKVSFAGGRFVVRWNGVEYDATGEGAVTILARRAA